MSKIRFLVLLLFLLKALSDNSFAQIKAPSKNKIAELTEQSKEYLKDANFEKSLKTSRLALQLAIAKKDDYYIATSYNTIAVNFYELSELDKAIFFYNKSLVHANKTDDNALKNRINNNLGNIYCFEKKQYKKGIEYYKKSLEYAQKIADTSQLVFTNLNITWSYFDIGKFDEGFPYLEYINKYHEKFGNESTIVVFNMLNGMYSGYKGDNKKANSYFLKSIDLGNRGEDKTDLPYSYQEYSKFLLKNKDYKKAYENLEHYNTLSEKLYNEEKLEKAGIAGINLELDEYKREIDRIETEKDSQNQVLQKSKVIVVLFLIILFILLILLYTLYKNNNYRKKANAKLTFANEELVIAKEKAEESSLLKTQFVSTISHELRTPLYGVIGIADILVDEHEELAESPHLNSLKFSAKYLLSLVNDILQINKIEENRIILETLTFNISDEIHMIKKSLSFLSSVNNNQIKVEIDPEIPEYLIGDKLRLAQIIMNLVSNALKFTKNGEVFIAANLVKVENKAHYIEFKIKDNGIGIASSDQDKIFEKFVQVGRVQTDYQGTGLGLSIVKRLLAVFGSSIALESAIGKGTQFTFTIAFDCDPAKTNEIINNIQVDLTSNQKIKVLVVEDNHINQLVTKKTIEKNNFKCTVVDNGYSALEILDKEFFDIILMDINMPLMNGFETTRRIRHMGIKTPVVALTAFDKAEITEESISAGINDIIIKPFESENLFKSINSLVFKTKTAS